MAIKSARVLTTLIVAGVGLSANQVIEADEALIDSLGDSVDATPEAVAYCIEHEGAKPVVIQDEAAADGDEGNSKLTVAEIKEKLEALGVEYPSGAKKPELLALLEEAGEA